MELDRKVLTDYIDACELIRETEQEINKLRNKRVQQDSVKDSMRDAGEYTYLRRAVQHG